MKFTSKSSKRRSGNMARHEFTHHLPAYGTDRSLTLAWDRVDSMKIAAES